MAWAVVPETTVFLYSAVAWTFTLGCDVAFLMPVLRPDATFWQGCEREHGRGYRDRIKARNASWFSANDNTDGDERVVSLVQEAWRETIDAVRGLIAAE